MGFKFVHMADVHLGTLQYGILERMKDFARAFRNVANFAIQRKVDFVLIAGDLFDKGNLSPVVLWQAEEVLRKLKDHDIPVVVIAGNHDRGDYRQGDFSWLAYLAAHDLLYLLDFSRDGDSLDLEPWDSSELKGGYVDLGPARIMGIRYVGIGVTNIIERLLPKIEQLARDPAYTILMLHIGIQGYTLPGQTGAEPIRLKRLEGLINYVALGHVHIRYDIGDWMYNPGSLETWRIDEANKERGFYLVEVDDAGHHSVTHHSDEVQRRPFWVIHIDLGTCRAIDDVLHAARQEVARRAKSEPDKSRYPVVVLDLRGKLSFDLGPDDEGRLRQAIKGELGFDDGFLSFVRVKWSQELSPGPLGGPNPLRFASRDAVEQQAWEQLYRAQPGTQSLAPQWAQLAMEVRRKALLLGTKVSPEDLADLIQHRWRELTEGGQG